jgi:protein-tyrosine-phosphatase
MISCFWDERYMIIDPKRVLFVGVENSNRSQVAEAFARMHGREKVEAYNVGAE